MGDGTMMGMNRRVRWIGRVGVALLLASCVFTLLSAQAVRAATVVVTTIADTTNACAANGTGSPCSLRDAVTYANAHSGTTITFQAGLTGTITLTGGKLSLNT